MDVVVVISVGPADTADVAGLVSLHAVHCELLQGSGSALLVGSAWH